jgi:hypothetical protein
MESRISTLEFLVVPPVFYLGSGLAQSVIDRCILGGDNRGVSTGGQAPLFPEKAQPQFFSLSLQPLDILR